MFDNAEEFFGALKAAVRDDYPQGSIEAVLQEALSCWAGPPPWLGSPSAADISILHTDDQVTIMNIVWPPHLITEPHNHNMWAAVAVYEGRENNVLWQRDGDTIAPSGAETICAGEVLSLGADTIHSVHNPLDKYTAAIHVYGGDFMRTDRSEWDPELLVERPRDPEATRRAFANADKSI